MGFSNIFEMVNAGSTQEKMYKCVKEVLHENGFKSLCDWEGVLQEYKMHMNSNHPNSCFKLQNNKIKFEWKIPFVGDQIDICLLENESNNILYKILYHADTQTMQHSFKCLENNSDVLIQIKDGSQIYECDLTSECPSHIKYKVQERDVTWMIGIY